MLRKTLLITIIAIVLISLFPTSVLAETGPRPPITPDEPTDCGVWAYNPVRSGSSVNGKGEISCATNHPSLKVGVQVCDWTGRCTSPAVTKTCSNTNYCSATASLSYSSARQWKTAVSGYQGTAWQAYYETSWVSIP